MTFSPPTARTFASSRRTMFLFAHQDDELPYAGLIQRAPPTARFLWLTNGDGLADEMGMSLPDYADARRTETVMAMREAGVGSDRLTFLGHSEVAIYAALTRVAREDARPAALDFFRSIARDVEAAIRAFDPEVVFTLAWQGGHPEHDLAHIFTVAALAGPPGVEVYELPEYELKFLIPLRFAPWRRGKGFEIELSRRELEVKRRMRGLYPTQARIVRQFTALTGLIGAIAGGVLSIEAGVERFSARETFATVPRDRDYTSPPHGTDRLEYIGDDFEGEPISFRKMVRPVVLHLMQAPRSDIGV